MKSSVSSVLLGGVAVLSWSTVATAFKVALKNMSVFEMLFVACATALCIFTVWTFSTGAWRELRTLSLPVWRKFALLGLVMPVTYYYVMFSAYDFLPAQMAQPINYVWPIMLAVLLAVFAHKPIPQSKYLGMGVSLIGVTLISFGGKSINGQVSIVGIALALISAVLWSLYWIFNEELKDKVSECTSLFLTFLFGMTYLLIASIFFPLSSLSAEALLSGVYIGAFEMGIPFICFGIAIRQTNNPALINQMCYLAPILSLLFICIVLGERIVYTTYCGLLLIVGGLVYNQYFSGKKITIRLKS